MALQPIFGQDLSEKIPPLNAISNEVRPVRVFLGFVYRLLILKLGSLWYVGLSCHVPSVAQSTTPTTPMTFGLLLLYTPSTIFWSYIVCRTVFSKMSNRFSSLFVSTYVSLPYSRTHPVL
jgi:hypothetical protein